MTTTGETYAPVPNWLMRRRDVSATAKLIYARLLQYRGANLTAWPGIGTLADEIGITSRNVIKHLDTLENKLHLLRVEHRVGYRASNRYHLLNPTSDGNITSVGNVTSDGTITRTSVGNVTSLVSEPSPKENKKKSGKRTNTLVEIPDSLNVPLFVEAWEKWQQHRRELRKPLTATASASLLSKLAGWGVTRAVAGINHSIAAGWQGIFEPEADCPGQRNQPPPPDYAWKREHERWEKEKEAELHRQNNSTLTGCGPVDVGHAAKPCRGSTRTPAFSQQQQPTNEVTHDRCRKTQ